MADEVKDLFQRHGLDPETTLTWARERARALLADVGEGELTRLLEGIGTPTPRPARAVRVYKEEPSVAHPLPPLPTRAAREDEEPDDVEELDLEEVEELDAEELELIDEVDEDESDYDDIPVRSGGTAPHAVVGLPIADDRDEDDDEHGEGDGDLDDGSFGDDSIPIDLDDE